MSTLASVTIYDVYSNLPSPGIPGRLFFVSTGTNAGNGYYDTGSAWELIVSPGGSSPLTTKGDIYGYSTTNARIPVGTDGYVLTAASGAALGVSWQAPSSFGGVIGTAKFSASGGTISGLVTQGAVSGVTRTGTGAYVVTLTGSPSDYLVIGTGGDATEPFVSAQIDPVTSYGTSGFTIQYFAGGAVYDPALLFITVILL